MAIIFERETQNVNGWFGTGKRKVPIGTAPADEARLSPFIRGRGSFDRVV